MYRYTKWTALREVGFWIGALVVFSPVYLLISLSLKSPAEAAESPLSPPDGVDLSNYEQAWSTGGTGSASFAHALMNSITTTGAVVILLIVLGAPAGYVIARRGSKPAGTLFWVFVAGLLLPAQLGMLPLFVAMRNVGLVGTQLGLILVFVGLLLPLSVFLYTGFIRGLPTDYEEAALVDGASRTKVFLQIVLPLMRPVTGTVAILCGVFAWNDFFTPLIFTGGTDNVTLPAAIQSYVGRYVSQWNLIFAGIVIALVPVVAFYLVSQRYVIRGFVTGVRG